MSITQINQGLARYYKHQGVQYYDDDQKGLFETWCETCGYETDDVIDELNDQNPENWTFPDFDDKFPIIKLTDNDEERAIEMHKIITHCYENENAFIDSCLIPEKDSAITEEKNPEVSNTRRSNGRKTKSDPANITCKPPVIIDCFEFMGYNRYAVIKALAMIDKDYQPRAQKQERIEIEPSTLISKLGDINGKLYCSLKYDDNKVFSKPLSQRTDEETTRLP